MDQLLQSASIYILNICDPQVAYRFLLPTHQMICWPICDVYMPNGAIITSYEIKREILNGKLRTFVQQTSHSCASPNLSWPHPHSSAPTPQGGWWVYRDSYRHDHLMESYSIKKTQAETTTVPLMLTLWETCLVHRSSALQCFAVATQSCAAGANIIQQGSEKVVIPHELFEAKTMKELMSANISNYKSESRTHHFPPGAPSSEPNPQCRSQCWQWPLCQSQRHARDCQGGNKENCLTLFLDFCSSLASSLSWFKRECIYLYCLYHIDFDFHVQKFPVLGIGSTSSGFSFGLRFCFRFLRTTRTGNGGGAIHPLIKTKVRWRTGWNGAWLGNIANWSGSDSQQFKWFWKCSDQSRHSESEDFSLSTLLWEVLTSCSSSLSEISSSSLYTLTCTISCQQIEA